MHSRKTHWDLIPTPIPPMLIWSQTQTVLQTASRLTVRRPYQMPPIQAMSMRWLVRSDSKWSAVLLSSIFITIMTAYSHKLFSISCATTYLQRRSHIPEWAKKAIISYGTARDIPLAQPRKLPHRDPDMMSTSRLHSLICQTLTRKPRWIRQLQICFRPWICPARRIIRRSKRSMIISVPTSLMITTISMMTVIH